MVHKQAAAVAQLSVLFPNVLLSLLPGNHRLALLLSQLVGSQPTRDLLTMQLVDWHRLQADCFIPEERLRIFALLAGKPVCCYAIVLSFSHRITEWLGWKGPQGS